jgi:CubicO group peptidase (beta-lactamase class C family)
MIKRLPVILSFVLAAPAIFAQANFDTSGLKDKLRSVEQLFSASNAQSSGYSVGIFYNGNILYVNGFGMADIAEKVPMTASSKLEIGSTSKQFTAMCILLLEEQGKIKLTDDIKKYLPFISFQETITIYNLLHHTSGLENYIQIYKKPSDEPKLDSAHAVDFIKGSKLLFKPGEKYVYCPTNYLLLAFIVEKISGEAFSEFARKNIFLPLGMSDTYFQPADSTWKKNRATGYEFKKKKYVDAMVHNKNIGDGGLITTIADLKKWDDNFYGNTLGSQTPRLIEKMLETGTLNNGEKIIYACGLGTGMVSDIPFVGHNGRSWGFSSKMRLFIPDHFSVYVISNMAYEDTEGAYKYCNDIIGIFKKK